jgi:aminoglycoside 6'-N-acetyltransferase I
MMAPPANDARAQPGEEPIEFRIMDESDRGAYCALFQQVFASPPWNEKWSLNGIDRDIRKVMRKKGFIGMVAAAGHKSIGFIAGSQLKILPKIFYLAQLFVDDKVRGKGIGNNLVRETMTIAKERGVSKIILLTKPDSEAEKFYRRIGFIPLLSTVLINGKCVLYKRLS